MPNRAETANPRAPRGKEYPTLEKYNWGETMFEPDNEFGNVKVRTRLICGYGSCAKL